MMLRELRKSFVDAMWCSYIKDFAHLKDTLYQQRLILDHFAIIDLPSQRSGRHYIWKILKRIGYKFTGKGYLEEKINDFIWFKQEDYRNKSPYDMLPQIIAGDFRADNLSAKTKAIIQKYTSQIKEFEFDQLDSLLHMPPSLNTARKGATLISNYFLARRW